MACEHRGQTEALFVRSECLRKVLVASSAVPGASPTQRTGIYEGSSSSVAHQQFVDGEVTNNSPVHIATSTRVLRTWSLSRYSHAIPATSCVPPRVAAVATCCWRRLWRP